MPKGLITQQHLEDIADAIRGRNNSLIEYKPSEMAAAVSAIPNSYTAGDEGKVVKNGALVAQTARAATITENGTYDTTENNEVTVNVSGGGGSGNTILHETEYSTSGSFSYSKEVTIPKTSNYKITVQTYSNGFSLKINGVDQSFNLSVVSDYTYLYYSELSLSAGDVIKISCTSSGRSIVTFVITEI